MTTRSLREGQWVMTTDLQKVLLAGGLRPQSVVQLSEGIYESGWREQLALAGSKDDDGDDDGGDGGHEDHATYKKLVKKGVNAKLAAKMCAKSDDKVAATAEELAVYLSVSQAVRDKAASSGHALKDGSYPIENVKQLHSAAHLAATGHGNVSAAKALIRRRAKDLGVDVNTLEGFGDSDGDNDGD